MGALPEAPTINGVLKLEESEILAIREDLRTIRDAFEPTIDMANVNIHYIVSEYNDLEDKKLNGDTAAFILGYLTEEEMILEESRMS